MANERNNAISAAFGFFRPTSSRSVFAVAPRGRFRDSVGDAAAARPELVGEVPERPESTSLADNLNVPVVLLLLVELAPTAVAAASDATDAGRGGNRDGSARGLARPRPLSCETKAAFDC